MIMISFIQDVASLVSVSLFMVAVSVLIGAV